MPKQIIATSSDKVRLFKDGIFSTTVNFTVPAETFYSIGSVDISPLTIEEVTIICFSHYHYGDDEWLEEAIGSFATVNTSGGLRILYGGYRVNGSLIEFGAFNLEGTSVIPIAPYSTGRIQYSIFY